MKRFLMLVVLVVFGFEVMAQSSDTTIYNKVWVLQKMNNRKLNYKENDPRITLVITQENEYASGSSGCNTYVSQVVIRRSHIMFREIGSTQMACPDDNMTNERIYLNNLNDVDSFNIIDEDLYLYKNDRPILIYSKY